MIELSSIQPVLLTCNRPGYMKVFTDFVASYVGAVQPSELRSPAILLDQTFSDDLSNEYVKTLAMLNPSIVRTSGHGAHPTQLEAYNSIQNSANRALQLGLELADAAYGIKFILFIEDDIKFSSRFTQALEIMDYPNSGMTSLYLPGEGHQHNGNGRIRTDQFYGTQAVLFPVKVVRLLIENEQLMMLYAPPGYDIRWSRYIDSLGFDLYQSKHSFVQHTGTESRLAGGADSHYSQVFYA